MSRETMKYTLVRETPEGEDEIPLTLEFDFSPGCPAWGGSRFEPPINPPEAAEFEIIRILRDGVEFLATDAEILKMYDYIAENYEDTRAADRADYLYDQWKDRQLEDKE